MQYIKKETPTDKLKNMSRIYSLKASYETEQRDKLKCEHLFPTLSSVLTQLIPISTVPSLPVCVEFWVYVWVRLCPHCGEQMCPLG